MAKQAIAKLGYIDCVIYLKEGHQLIQKAAHGPKNPKKFDIKDPIKLQIGEGIAGSVALTGKSILVSDASKDPRYLVDDVFRYSEISVPIISNNEVIGVIDSEHPSKNFYNENDLEILETIASMVSIKIDQAKAIQKLLDQKKTLEYRVDKNTEELEQTITQLTLSNEEILQSDLEKETLLKEIHHRVKNNLQIVSSLLNLHSYKTENTEAQEVFKDCQNRVKSMSVIHEQLYSKGNLSKIDAKNYIEEITQELMLSYNASNDISIEYELEQVYYDLHVSVPFGLILNELIANALKYAFPENKGTIIVKLHQKGSQITLIISDNGIGFDPSNVKHESLGLELVETLSNQINGDLSIDSSNNGTDCMLTFKV